MDIRRFFAAQSLPPIAKPSLPALQVSPLPVSPPSDAVSNVGAEAAALKRPRLLPPTIPIASPPLPAIVSHRGVFDKEPDMILSTSDIDCLDDCDSDCGDGDCKLSAKDTCISVRFTSLDGSALESVKKLHSIVFPVPYSDKFFLNVLTTSESGFTELAYVGSTLIGVICCRLEDITHVVDAPRDDVSYATVNTQSISNDGPRYAVYIMTLGVLATYRSLGIASRLLSIIYRRAQVFNSQQRLAADDKHESDAAVVKPPPHIDQLRLHVQLSNESALSFYKKRNFQITSFHSNYYAHITPRDAVLLTLAVLDHPL